MHGGDEDDDDDDDFNPRKGPSGRFELNLRLFSFE